jgi:sodium transport system permease protein
MIIATGIVYGGVPLIFAHWRRVNWQTGFSWRLPPVLSWFGALLLGLSLWPFAHEIVVVSQMIGFATLEKVQFNRAQELIDQARQTPLLLFLAAIAFAPAVFEEFCFRGFMFGAFRARMRPWVAVLLTGLVFGLFHLVTSDALAVERLLPSTALGCVLGWVCWRTGSLFPGIVLHAAHNGFLALVIYYLPELKQRGWGIEEQSHLPATWLAAAGIGCFVGAAIIWLSRRRGEDSTVMGQKGL